jgi:hypothetical protein
MVSIRALLLEIQNSQVFEKLEAFKPADVWQNWESNERTLLAQLLIMQGSQQIAAGDLVMKIYAASILLLKNYNPFFNKILFLFPPGMQKHAYAHESQILKRIQHIY